MPNDSESESAAGQRRLFYSTPSSHASTVSSSPTAFCDALLMSSCPTQRTDQRSEWEEVTIEHRQQKQTTSAKTPPKTECSLVNYFLPYVYSVNSIKNAELLHFKRQLMKDMTKSTCSLVLRPIYSILWLYGYKWHTVAADMTAGKVFLQSV